MCEKMFQQGIFCKQTVERKGEHQVFISAFKKRLHQRRTTPSAASHKPGALFQNGISALISMTPFLCVWHIQKKDVDVRAKRSTTGISDRFALKMMFFFVSSDEDRHRHRHGREGRGASPTALERRMEELERVRFCTSTIKTEEHVSPTAFHSLVLKDFLCTHGGKFLP